MNEKNLKFLKPQDRQLLETWGPMLNLDSVKGKRVMSIDNIQTRIALAKVLENTQKEMSGSRSTQDYIGGKILSEGTQTTSTDIAQFANIIAPIVRRTFPQLLAQDIVGVQPMSTPTSRVFALRATYGLGEKEDVERTPIERDGTGMQRKPTTVVLILDKNVNAEVIGTNVNLTADPTIIGKILYFEKNKLALGVDTSVVDINSFKNAIGQSITSPTETYNIVSTIDNEAGYNLVFKHWSGAHKTDIGENLKFSDGTLKNLKARVESATAEAFSRKIGCDFTIESVQDL